MIRKLLLIGALSLSSLAIGVVIGTHMRPDCEWNAALVDFPVTQKEPAFNSQTQVMGRDGVETRKAMCIVVQKEDSP